MSASASALKKFTAKQARSAMKAVFKESLRPKTAPRAYPITEEASKVFNRDTASHRDLLKDVWTYIKKNNLQDTADKRIYNCDAELKKLFGVDSFKFTEVPSYTNKLIVKPDAQM